jgi:S1-C subfamily serine protease
MILFILILLLLSQSLHAQTLVDFTQPNCGPCLELEPVLAQLRSAGYRIKTIDVSVDRDAMEKWHVNSTPTLVMFDARGYETRRASGVQSLQTLRSWFAEAGDPANQLQPVAKNQQQPHPSVVRVQVPLAEGRVAFGSGVLVAPDTVLTNWHVVNEAVGPPTVYFPGQPAITGSVLKTDRVWDLAAITVAQTSAQPVRIAQQPAKVGDPLTIIGYGPEGVYRAASGRCSSYGAPGAGLPNEFFEISTAARSGDSGGPVLNAAGELAGVLNGSDHRASTIGPCSLRICRFLGRLGQPPVASPTTIPQPPDARGGLLQAIPADLLARVQQLEQQITQQPAALGAFRSEIETKLAALKTDLAAHPEKLVLLEQQVASLAALVASGTAPAAAGGLAALLPALAAGPVGWGVAGVGAIAMLLKKLSAAQAATSTVTPAINPLSLIAQLLANQAAQNPAVAAPTSSAPVVATPSATSTAAPTVVTLQTPPSPQVVTKQQAFYPVQTPTARQQAFEQAVQWMGQQNPQDLPFVNRLLSAVDQFEAGAKQQAA